MTVSSDLNRISYAGNGTTTLFPVNYYFLDNTHLQVILITSAGVETIQTLTTNYTVAGAGNPAGGSVTMNVPPPTGTTIVIQRDVPATQETDYLANDPFPAESHERALDKLTMLVQQNEREAGRALKIPLAAVPTTNTELPLPEGNKLLAWNSNASAVTNFDPGSIISIVGQQNSFADTFTGNGSTVNFTLTRQPGSVFNLDVSVNGVTQVPNVDYILAGSTLTFTTAPPAVASQILARYSEVYAESIGDAQNVRYLPAGTGTQQTTVQAKLRETVSVKDFGAVGDGVTDDRAAIAAAIAASTGKKIFFPKGKYLINTDGGSISVSGLTLVGEGQQESGIPYDNNASVLLIKGTTNSPFSVFRGVTIEGISFFYPDQVETGSAPTAYPALFTGTFVTQFQFVNNTVINCYRFFEIPANGIAGDCRIRGNRIFAIDRAFQFSGGMPEVMHITDNIFSYGIYEDVVNVGPTYGIRNYYTNSGEWMRVDCGSGTIHQSVDGMNIHGNLIFGCRFGIRVQSGRFDVSIVDGNKFDAVPTALGVFDAAKINNTIISSNLFYSYRVADTAAKEPTIYFFSSGDTSNIHIEGNNFAFSQGSFIAITGSDNADDILISGNSFKNWARTTATPAVSYYAIAIGDSDLWGSIVSNVFTGNPAGSNTAVGIEASNVKNLLISANHFNSTYYAVKIDDAVGAFISGNQSSNTVFTQSFIDNGSTPAKVQASGNLWDKAPNLYAYPFVSATISTAQTFTGAKTKANFATETFDEDSNYDASTSTFTAPTNGLYSFSVALTNTTGVTAGDSWSCVIESTGSSTQTKGVIQYVAANQLGTCSFSVDTQFKLVAGDAVSVYLTRTGGSGNWVQINDAAYNYFICKKVQ